MIDREADGDKRAFYARRGGRRADYWTLLHPPYTAWNLSYVVMGASLAPRLDWLRLALTLAVICPGIFIGTISPVFSFRISPRVTVAVPSVATISTSASLSCLRSIWIQRLSVDSWSLCIGL